jgi:hypothetical protein
VFAVPREWTDLREPSPYEGLGMGPLAFDLDCLLHLVELVQEIDRLARRGLPE